MLESILYKLGHFYITFRPSGRPLIGSGGKFRADELTETVSVLLSQV